MTLLTNDQLTNIENSFWNKTDTAHLITKTITNLVVGSLIDESTTPTQRPTAVDLTSLSYEQIVRHLMDVQTVKLEQRNKPKRDGSHYTTYYKDAPSNICDVCAETIVYRGRRFILELRYNGSDHAKQPGNCLFTEDGRPPLRFDTLPNEYIDSPAIRLLFFIEIARRKAVDPHQNLRDEYYNLPVGLGTAMAYKLLGDQNIQLREFWLNSGDVHIFSSKYRFVRWKRFRNLCNVYYNYYINDMNDSRTIIDHLRNLMSNFYARVENLHDLAYSLSAIGLYTRLLI
ncbi:unnamed protein product [Adineta steineri]|uniref:Uncharacterized protein n=2 Tax=Adineta steineri TaxID=433720 RepID=A0A815T8A9_9BILA|nr:unnamed protein product [Adineta steineri]